MTKKVYIENGDGFYRQMWRRWGWDISHDYMDADVIQFTGGSDVNPALYDEVAHPRTGYDNRRDQFCIGVFKYAKDKKIPMTGICRGGQFLNVMNGGTMFQDVDNHAIGGTHKATILATGVAVDVTSTHHQMMRPNRATGIVLMEANPKLATRKEFMAISPDAHDGKWAIASKPEEDDIESVYYPDTLSVCYQPHPEWCDEKSGCVAAYKSFLRNYLELVV